MDTLAGWATEMTCRTSCCPRRSGCSLARASSLSAGAYHSLALTADGAVWSWGGGGSGKLGHGDEQRQLLPKKVEALAGQRIVAVSAGEHHSLALTADGSVWSWG